VIDRAKEAGCRKLIVTGSDLGESRKGVELARGYRKWFKGEMVLGWKC
jgi:TatD DNase family protein